MTVFLPQALIAKKRDGGALNEAEIAFIVDGLVSGSLSEGQVAAFAMAVFFRGMSIDERAALTLAMARSGRIVDWRAEGIDRPVLDKHSTGGVGDKVSLILAPIVAACGGAVPMIAGRGLGHTGGTIDKLEAIPGYRVAPDFARWASALKQAGCAIIGQTAEIAPADRRFYAIRDVTGTVESIPLITASILSKKLAAGLDALVMDVKYGSGAFMAEEERAAELGHSIVHVSEAAGLPCRMYLTDMNQALGHAAGNALEVREAIAFLTGARRDHRLASVTLTLAGEMLELGGLADGHYSARMMAERALASGAALEHFARMVAGLGGPADLIERPDDYLAAAPVQRAVAAPRAGYVAALDVRRIGWAIVALGGGRARVEDRIDPSVGLSEVAGIGDEVGPDRPLAICHAASIAAAERCAAEIQASIVIADEPPLRVNVISARH
jgi:thymidine phosphorylase